MDFLSVITACLIISVSIHEIKYWKSVVIKANKSKLEILLVCVGIVVFSIITIFFAKNLLHYLIFPWGVMFVLTDVWKLGISENGLLIAARGKELYKWAEIHHVEMTISDKVKIVYFTKSNSEIATQFYSLDSFDAIMALFKKHNVSFDQKRGI